LSGPLADRFDLALELPPVRSSELDPGAPAESSAAVRSRVMAARARQAARQSTTNARLESARLRAEWNRLDADARRLVSQAADRFGWSARSVARVIRVSRTIADLETADAVAVGHVSEAVQYRTA
jgi:magnesium chelatase family protein